MTGIRWIAVGALALASCGCPVFGSLVLYDEMCPVSPYGDGYEEVPWLESARLFGHPLEDGSGGTFDLEFEIDGQRYRAVYSYVNADSER